MTDSTQQVQVILTGLEDESAQGIERFKQHLAQTFNIPLSKAEMIIENRPFTVKKACPPEAAERLAHTLARLGAVYRIEPAASAPTPASIPTAAPAPSPPVAASPPVPAAPEVSAPASPAPGPSGWESLGAIPVAGETPSTGGAPEMARPVPGSIPAQGTETVEEVACTECGTVQSADRKACNNCYFPLPQKKAPAHDEMEPDPGPTARPRGVVVYSGAATGYGELQQCAPPIYVAAGLLFATALINIWSVAFFSDMVGPAGIVSALIDIALGVGLLRGSATARTWVLVRAVVGGALWGLVALGTGDLAGFMFQEVYSVSLIVLLVGRGSLLKAVLVGIPNAAVMALAVLGLALMTVGASLMGGLDPAAMMVEQAAELEANGRYDQAIEVYRQALNVPSTENDPELQALIYMNLGAAYMGQENFVKAIPELQASVALQDDDPHAHFLLGMSYFQVGQEDRALEELLRVRELDPAYPDLDASIKAVTEYTSGEHRY